MVWVLFPFIFCSLLLLKLKLKPKLLPVIFKLSTLKMHVVHDGHVYIPAA